MCIRDSPPADHAHTLSTPSGTAVAHRCFYAGIGSNMLSHSAVDSHFIAYAYPRIVSAHACVSELAHYIGDGDTSVCAG
eukprot:2570999-Pyramimonas_sp.AAC.1